MPVDELHKICIESCNAVDSELSEHQKRTLKSISLRLCSSIDDNCIERIRKLYAELSANPQNAGLQGGTGEMWTFRDSGDIDISFPLQLAPGTHESHVSLGESRDNGNFKLSIEPNGNDSELWYLGWMWRLYMHQYKAFVAMHFLIWTGFCALMGWSKISLVPMSTLFASYFLDKRLGKNILKPMLNLLQRITPFQNLLDIAFPSAQGPALTNNDFKVRQKHLNVTGIDIVPFVPAPSAVDSLLTEWRQRHRKKFQHFPRDLDAYCDLGMVMFDFREQNWRLSSTEFECQWIRNLPKEQGLILSIAKYLAKNDKLTNQPISSYPIKMSFFWFVFFSNDNIWSLDSVCLNALKVLRFLNNCLKIENESVNEGKCFLPNYFYLEENVLQKYADRRYYARVPTTAQTMEHLDNAIITDKFPSMIEQKIFGVEQLLKDFCQGKYKAADPWKSSSFLLSRITFEGRVNQHKIFVSSSTHGILMTLVTLPLCIGFSISGRITFWMLILIAGSSLAVPAIPFVLWEFGVNSILYFLVKAKFFGNTSPFRPMTDTRAYMKDVMQKACADVKVIVRDIYERLPNPSHFSSRLFTPELNCIDDAAYAFDCIPNAILIENVRGFFSIEFPLGVSSIIHKMLFAHAFWFDLSFGIAATAALYITCGLNTSSSIHAYFLVLAPMVLQLFLPELYRYGDLKVTWLRFMSSQISKLPISLSLLAWLRHCLFGEAVLRVRTECPSTPVLTLTDARNMRWRFCHDHFQTMRQRNLSEEQKFCYCTTLSLATILGVSHSNLERVQMAFDWAVALIPTSEWTMSNVTQNALIVLEFCRQCHRRACLPNYFHSRENFALINTETFNGLPKCQPIVQHVLLSEQRLENWLQAQQAVGQAPEGSSAAGWGCGILGARVRILVGDFCFRYFVSCMACLPAAIFNHFF